MFWVEISCSASSGSKHTGHDFCDQTLGRFLYSGHLTLIHFDEMCLQM